MGDLISREALKKEVENLVAGGAERLKDYYENGSKKEENEWIGGVYDVWELIDNAPTVPQPDFKEGYKQAIRDGKTNFTRPQGEWELAGMIYYCSECGHYCEQGGNNFCGNCGADMRTKKRMSEEEYLQNVGRLYTDEEYLGGEEE